MTPARSNDRNTAYDLVLEGLSLEKWKKELIDVVTNPLFLRQRLGLRFDEDPLVAIRTLLKKLSAISAKNAGQALSAILPSLQRQVLRKEPGSEQPDAKTAFLNALTIADVLRENIPKSAFKSIISDGRVGRDCRSTAASSLSMTSSVDDVKYWERVLRLSNSQFLLPHAVWALAKAAPPRALALLRCSSTPEDSYLTALAQATGELVVQCCRDSHNRLAILTAASDDRSPSWLRDLLASALSSVLGDSWRAGHGRSYLASWSPSLLDVAFLHELGIHQSYTADCSSLPTAIQGGLFRLCEKGLYDADRDGLTARCAQARVKVVSLEYGRYIDSGLTSFANYAMSIPHSVGRTRIGKGEPAYGAQEQEAFSLDYHSALKTLYLFPVFYSGEDRRAHLAVIPIAFSRYMLVLVHKENKAYKRFLKTHSGGINQIESLAKNLRSSSVAAKPRGPLLAHIPAIQKLDRILRTLVAPCRQFIRDIAHEAEEVAKGPRGEREVFFTQKNHVFGGIVRDIISDQRRSIDVTHAFKYVGIGKSGDESMVEEMVASSDLPGPVWVFDPVVYYDLKLEHRMELSDFRKLHDVRLIPHGQHVPVGLGMSYFLIPDLLRTPDTLGQIRPRAFVSLLPHSASLAGSGLFLDFSILKDKDSADVIMQETSLSRDDMESALESGGPGQ